MEKITIISSFVVAILGIAYPILFQVISGLDEKYNSTLIQELFNKEKIKKVFRCLLIISLFAVFLAVLNLPPLIKIKGFDFIIDNSAFLFLLLSTTGLVIIFIIFVEKILVYYTPNKFIMYLIIRHKKEKDKENFIYFKCISDFFYFSIRNQNENIVETISDFM